MSLSAKSEVPRNAAILIFDKTSREGFQGGRLPQAKIMGQYHWPNPHAELERTKGIEPSSVAWEATALPLSYVRDPRNCRWQKLAWAWWVAKAQEIPKFKKPRFWKNPNFGKPRTLEKQSPKKRGGDRSVTTWPPHTRPKMR